VKSTLIILSLVVALHSPFFRRNSARVETYTLEVSCSSPFSVTTRWSSLTYLYIRFFADPYTEEEAARITSSILSAVSYMHSKGVIHRDLKYENILFIDNNPRAEIKLIDFGLSKHFGHEDMTEGVGTV
jgi:serine/threonine protein kinase